MVLLSFSPDSIIVQVRIGVHPHAREPTGSSRIEPCVNISGSFFSFWSPVIRLILVPCWPSNTRPAFCGFERKLWDTIWLRIGGNGLYDFNRPSPSSEPQDCGQLNVFYCQASHCGEGKKWDRTPSAKDWDLRVGQTCQTKSKIPKNAIYENFTFTTDEIVNIIYGKVPPRIIG